MTDRSKLEEMARRRVSANIRRLIDEQNLSINKLSDFAAVNRPHLTRVLQCEADATVGWLARLADALGVDIVELVQEERSD